MTDRLVWIDCEMTGLDLARDALVEIACIVTDGQLNVADDGIDVIIKPPAEALDHMTDSDLLRALRGLPNEFRTTVYLADIEGYPYREIAEIMGTPVGTVMSRLHRGRRKIREQLGDSGLLPPAPVEG